jgi:hypothetical protein
MHYLPVPYCTTVGTYVVAGLLTQEVDGAGTVLPTVLRRGPVRTRISTLLAAARLKRPPQLRM